MTPTNHRLIDGETLVSSNPQKRLYYPTETSYLSYSHMCYWIKEPFMRKPLWIAIVVVLALAALASAPRVRSAGDPAPQVVDTEPVRGSELPLDSPITFYFDQPMDRPSVEAAFRATPSVKGALSWINDTTLVFKPDSQLTRATDYTFSIDASAKAKTTGLGLKDKFNLKLRSTGFLEVTQVLPANGANDVEATPTITVIFNRPV